MDNDLYELAYQAGAARDVDEASFDNWLNFMGGESWLSQNKDRGADRELLAKAFAIGGAENDLLDGELPRIPPVEYRSLVHSLGKGKAEAAEKTLDQIIFNAVRLRGYIEGRLRHGDSDRAHTQAVELSNRQVRSVRSTFGYHTTTDLSY